MIMLLRSWTKKIKIRYKINGNGHKYTYFINCSNKRQIERKIKSRFYKVTILRIDHDRREIDIAK